jgi:glutamate racemase
VHFICLADNADAPYGKRSAKWLVARAQQITEQLRAEHAIHALVMACNTATSLAIDDLRKTHHDRSFIDVWTALQPAATLPRNGHIGVLATPGTVQSARFPKLLAGLHGATDYPLHVRCLPRNRLAYATERADAPAMLEQATHSWEQLRRQDPDRPRIDTLVLGCTQQDPFARDVLQALCGPDVVLVETVQAVAQRTCALCLSLSWAGQAQQS